MLKIPDWCTEVCDDPVFFTGPCPLLIVFWGLLSALRSDMLGSRAVIWHVFSASNSSLLYMYRTCHTQGYFKSSNGLYRLLGPRLSRLINHLTSIIWLKRLHYHCLPEVTGYFSSSELWEVSPLIKEASSFLNWRSLSDERWNVFKELKKSSCLWHSNMTITMTWMTENFH